MTTKYYIFFVIVYDGFPINLKCITLPFFPVGKVFSRFRQQQKHLFGNGPRIFWHLRSPSHHFSFSFFFSNNRPIKTIQPCRARKVEKKSGRENRWHWMKVEQICLIMNQERVVKAAIGAGIGPEWESPVWLENPAASTNDYFFTTSCA